MSDTSEAINSNAISKEKKALKHVTILDPKSPSSRPMYEKMASENGYSFEDRAPLNLQDKAPNFPSYLTLSPPPISSFPSPPHHSDVDNQPTGPNNKDRSIYGIPYAEWLRLTDAEREGLKRNARKVSCYRTRLCRAWMKGTCPYGPDCNFAHGEDQLRNPPLPHPKYKTMLCRNFVNGVCPYGERCQFIHKFPVNSQSFSYSMGMYRSDLLASSSTSNRYTLRNSMIGLSSSFGISHSGALTDLARDYRQPDLSLHMGLQGNNPSATETPKRAFSSSMFPMTIGSRAPRTLSFNLGAQSNSDNLASMLQRMSIPEDEEHLDNSDGFRGSIRGRRLDI